MLLEKNIVIESHEMAKINHKNRFKDRLKHHNTLLKQQQLSNI